MDHQLQGWLVALGGLISLRGHHFLSVWLTLDLPLLNYVDGGRQGTMWYGLERNMWIKPASLAHICKILQVMIKLGLALLTNTIR